MARMSPMPEHLSRPAAVALLRAELARLAGTEHSMCSVAAERGIFCRGFKRYADQELRARYDWIDERRPGLHREELERLADSWQLARQEFHHLPLSCDVQTKEHDTCWGWDDFTNEDLTRHIVELTRRNVIVG